MAFQFRFDVQDIICNHETVRLYDELNILRATLTKAVRYEVTRREAPQSNSPHPAGLWEMERTGGVVLGADVQWTMGDNDIETVDPYDISPAWYIVDEFERKWIILERSHSEMALFTKALTRNRRLSHRLNHIVDVQHADQSRGTDMSYVPVWTTVSSGEVTRVQFRHNEPYEERGVEGVMSFYDVYFENEIAARSPTGTWARLKWTLGGVTKYLELTDYFNSERIDILPKAEARWTP